LAPPPVDDTPGVVSTAKEDDVDKRRAYSDANMVVRRLPAVSEAAGGAVPEDICLERYLEGS
jgi:hypothetical protein